MGCREFVDFLNESKTALHKDPIYISRERENVAVEVALQYTDSFAETIFTYANNINTIEGGTHLIGLKQALTRGLNTYGAEERPS